ncbi:hypothetical protein EDD86DRAFT_208872 [Gorgonomyces haynaldii]|nr:hypothetical protein EDD86DRAFT_208872 [Gorgonomyces haynaldii]
MIFDGHLLNTNLERIAQCSLEPGIHTIKLLINNKLEQIPIESQLIDLPLKQPVIQIICDRLILFEIPEKTKLMRFVKHLKQFIKPPENRETSIFLEQERLKQIERELEQKQDKMLQILDHLPLLEMPSFEQPPLHLDQVLKNMHEIEQEQQRTQFRLDRLSRELDTRQKLLMEKQQVLEQAVVQMRNKKTNEQRIGQFVVVLLSFTTLGLSMFLYYHLRH